MKADPGQQRELLKIQTIDTALAKAAHRLRTLPVRAELLAAQEQAEAINVKISQAASDLQGHRRDLSNAEDAVVQVETKLAKHRQRLDAGSASAKEIQAIEGDIAHLQEKLSELEDLEIAAMEVAENGEAAAASLATQAAEAAAEIARLQQSIDTQAQEIETEIAGLQAERQVVVSPLDTALVAEYNRVRERTGGVGAVALYGQRTEGVGIEFSVAELAEIRAASPDQLVYSEEYEYILVRMDG